MNHHLTLDTLADYRAHLANALKMSRDDSFVRILAKVDLTTEVVELAALRQIEIIDAMTEDQRADPKRIDANTRRQIAAATGTESYQVKQLLDGFYKARDMMQRTANTSELEWLRTLIFRSMRWPF